MAAHRKPNTHQTLRRFAFAFSGIAAVYATATIAIPGTGSATDIYGQCDAPVMQAWEGCGHRTSDTDDFDLWNEEIYHPAPNFDDWYVPSRPTDMPPPPPLDPFPGRDVTERDYRVAKSLWSVLP